MMHPIVAQMQPNEEQRPAIAARGRDLVVTAGAGTGKTRTLVARYLYLLADGFPLRGIVAITFTQKAAQEMRSRIRSEMRRYLNRPDLTLEERRRWEAHYNELDAARIGTIHSLCTEILRAHPAEAAVDPRFEVLDEGRASIFKRRAIDEAMAWAADDEQAVKLFAFLGEWRVRSMLESLVGQRLEAMVAFEELLEDPWPAWQALLVPPLKAFVDDGGVRAAFDDLLLLRSEGFLDRANAHGDALAQPLQRLLEGWTAIQVAREQDDWITISAYLGSLPENMKQVGRKSAWAPADPKAIIKELKASYDELVPAWTRNINLDLDRQLAEASPALRRIFDRAVGYYHRLKRERQKLDFDDLEDMALKLLRDRSPVRVRWQKEVAALLVDEYQDTNGRQRDLINLINDRQGKLFIVGDAKQSIYRFRGADVAVFREERSHIEATGGDGYTLAKSYRAHRALIAGLNDLLRPVLGEIADPRRPWREPFAPLIHHREEPPAGLEAPFIGLHLTVGAKSEGALTRAATALVDHLAYQVERPDSNLSFGDIAILCRSSTSFGPYEDALDSLDVPYLTVAGRGFYDRPEIRDLLNALRALEDPGDDLALMGLLRSPVMSYSDADLYEIARRWDQNGRSTWLWHLLQSDEDGRINKTVDLINRLQERSGRIPVTDLLKAFLDETNYRAALLNAGYSRPARNVTKLLNDAHTSGLVSVREFLDYVTGLQAGAAREGEARATAGDVVRIMSVHAAKGLEFPVVVIGDINYGRSGGAGLLIDPELGIHPPLDDGEGRRAGLYRLLQEVEADKEEAESERLLYVAATRAREKLILNGCIKLTGKGRPGWLNGWLKKLAGPLHLDSLSVEDYDDAGDRAHSFELMVGQTPVSCTVYEPQFPISPISLPPEPEPGMTGEWSPDLLGPVPISERWLDERTEIQERDPPRRVWRVVPDSRRPAAPAWIVGSLVHEALRVWRFPDLDFEDWARARAQELGLLDDERLGDAARKAKQLLDRFQGHPLYAEMAAAEKRLHEVPYTLVDAQGKLEQGIVDAIYLQGGLWTVVDFKTDRVDDADGFAHLVEERGYQKQLERYGTAVARLTGQQPRTILCMLNYAGRIVLEPDITNPITD